MISSFSIIPFVDAQIHDKTLYEKVKQSPKTEVSHIDVGKYPLTIKHEEYGINDNVYVANSGSGTVSVINQATN